MDNNLPREPRQRPSSDGAATNTVGITPSLEFLVFQCGHGHRFMAWSKGNRDPVRLDGHLCPLCVGSIEMGELQIVRLKVGLDSDNLLKAVKS